MKTDTSHRFIEDFMRWSTSKDIRAVALVVPAGSRNESSDVIQ
jgi:hypothetical protein